MEEIKNVFVYGTLKRGDDSVRSNVMKDGGAVWAGCTHVYGYLMHRGPFPALVLEEGGSKINGEVFTGVSTELLDELDNIEGVPNFYHRLPVELGNGFIAWVYVMPHTELKPDTQIIPSGDWYGQATFSLAYSKWQSNVAGRNPPYKHPAGKPALSWHDVAKVMCVRQTPRRESFWNSEPPPKKPVTPWEDGGCIPGVKLEWAGSDEVVPDYEVKSQALKGI